MPVQIDMDMPASCRACPMCDLHNFECRLKRDMDIWTIGHKGRPDWCPLREVE